MITLKIISGCCELVESSMILLNPFFEVAFKNVLYVQGFQAICNKSAASTSEDENSLPKNGNCGGLKRENHHIFAHPEGLVDFPQKSGVKKCLKIQ